MGTQIRGNCQCCGRDQAVMNGVMAQHGYTVENGWYQGVCNGHHFAPVQKDREEVDHNAALILKQADELDAKAAALEAGNVPPNMMVRYTFGMEKPAMVAFETVLDYDKAAVLKGVVYTIQNRAKAGRDFVKMMAALADKVHGQRLRKVAPALKTTPINPGDRKVGAKGQVLTALHPEGGRAYYLYLNNAGSKFKGWMGTQAWRALPNAA